MILSPLHINKSNTLQTSIQLHFHQTIALFRALVSFFFVLNEERASGNRALINGLFFTYAIPSIIVFGPSALLLLGIYQIIFKALLEKFV